MTPRPYRLTIEEQLLASPAVMHARRVKAAMRRVHLAAAAVQRTRFAPDATLMAEYAKALEAWWEISHGDYEGGDE